MNGDNKLAFPEWGTAPTSRPTPQCNSGGVTCNPAHTTPTQDELLLRTKAQWEKQQAAAAAAMCYWGYTDQSPLMFNKHDWRQMNPGRANIPSNPDNSRPHRPVDPAAQSSKTEPESRYEPNRKASRPTQSRGDGGTGSKKRSRAQPVTTPIICPGSSPTDVGPSSTKPFPCPDCGKSFRQHSQLLTHQRTHTGDRPYHCTDCPKAFRTQGTLVIHRRIHTGEKPYTCEECGRAFRTQGTLVIHRRTHTGDRPYKCHDCGKAFAARCSLVVHWRTHTGEKPYQCIECGKLFASRSDSARHARTHQGGNKKPSTGSIRRLQHPALQ